MTPRTDTEPESVPPDCGPTTDLLHAVLDGEATFAALEADGHAATCPTCRGRVAAARMLLAVYPPRPVPVAVPSGLADRVAARVRADRRRRAVLPYLALAAAVAVVVGLLLPPRQRPTDAEIVERPQPREPEPVRPPVRVGAELAKAGDALKETSRAIVEPAAAAPRLLAALSEAVAPPPMPPSPAVEPVRQSLAELPDAARAGLEPVAGSARKAWNRLLRDVGAVAAKPRS